MFVGEMGVGVAGEQQEAEKVSQKDSARATYRRLAAFFLLRLFRHIIDFLMSAKGRILDVGGNENYCAMGWKRGVKRRHPRLA